MFQTPKTIDLSAYGCPNVSAHVYPNAPAYLVNAFQEAVSNVESNEDGTTEASEHIERSAHIVAYGVVGFDIGENHLKDWGRYETPNPVERKKIIEDRINIAKSLPADALAHLSLELFKTFSLTSDEKKD